MFMADGEQNLRQFWFRKISEKSRFFFHKMLIENSLIVRIKSNPINDLTPFID